MKKIIILGFVAFLSILSIIVSERVNGQQRDAVVFVQDTEPTVDISIGSQWVHSNGTLKVLSSLSPSTWITISSGSSGENGSIPTGSILMIESGTCPTDFTEASSFNGRTLLGTVAANADIGTNGGNDSVTPTFTGNAFTDVINHTHTINVNDPTHNHTQNAHTHTLPVGATDDTASPFDRADAGTNASGANATTASGSTIATNIASSTGITATSSNPSGGVANITPTGTISQIDNRSSFRRVIFCKKD